MTDTIENLIRLETTLRKKAACALAQADVHKLAGEKHEQERELKRSKSGEFFADVCRDAVRKLIIRHKRGVFTPPTLDEALRYAKENFPKWDKADVEELWRYYESKGWKVGNAMMRDWEQAFSNGASRWQKKQPKSAAQGEPDPGDWPQFLKANGYARREYRYAAEFIQREYRAWKKQQEGVSK